MDGLPVRVSILYFRVLVRNVARSLGRYRCLFFRLFLDLLARVLRVYFLGDVQLVVIELQNDMPLWLSVLVDQSQQLLFVPDIVHLDRAAGHSLLDVVFDLDHTPHNKLS